MTLIAKWAVELAGKRAAARFDAATRDVARSQAAKLAELVARNATTEYGREHGFDAIRSAEDWRARVPVTTYADIQERVERMARGERGVLTAEDPVMFARTSGTTGKPKLIPVTPTCRGRDHADQMRTWLYHAQKEHPAIFRGRVMSLVSPAVEGHTEAGIPYGSTSGWIYKNMPSLVQRTYLVPYEVFEIEDYLARYYVLMRLGLAAHVTFLCTANPSTIVKLCEVADEHAEELLRDLRDGTLRADLELDGETRSIVEARLGAEPEVARRLEAARARRDGKLLAADYWPDLALVGCWKGGTVGSYVTRFPEWFDPDERGGPAVRDWGYLSSEARGSIPISDEGSGGVLTVATNYYEFVEADQLEQDPDDPDRWEFLGAHELDAPREYYVFLTTGGGLYRYDINDVVRVEGYYQEAPVINFQRKGRGMTSITGEKVSVDQISSAIDAAARASGVRVTHYRALADAPSARYVFQLEPESELSTEKGRELLQKIESELTSSNEEYSSKRKSLRLEPPELQVMKRGWYDRGKASQGSRLFQAKTVLLAQRETEEPSIRSEEMCVARISLDAAESRAE